MALKGLKIIELSGLAPAPFCGMVLADFGASVIRVDRAGSNLHVPDTLANGKKSLSLNLKHPKGANILRILSKTSDVLIEPFRKGVMEQLGLGPEVLLKENPRLIYARLTGYGQQGCFSKNAGHDINYVAMSGLLSLLGRYGENPYPPVNIIADFGGGGLMCALGILLAVLERKSSGLGQVVDSSMVHGAAYLGSWIYRTQHLPIWGEERGRNFLDSGRHFYEVYKTKDGKYVSVGALEPKFYAELLKGLELTEKEAPQFGEAEKLKKLFSAKFLQKTQEEWCNIFDNTDACVAPVLTLDEAPTHKHNLEESFFTETSNGPVPSPAPKLSRTPGESNSSKPDIKQGQHTEEILNSLGFTNEDIHQLVGEGVVECYHLSKL